MQLTKEEQRQFKSHVLPLLDDLHRLAYYLCYNEHDTEDLVAETIKKACEKFRTLRDHGKIKQALSEVPSDFRFVVVLCDVEGLSYEEISKMLEIPIGTVRSRIAHGRTILQKKLYNHAVERGLIRKREREHEKIRS